MQSKKKKKKKKKKIEYAKSRLYIKDCICIFFYPLLD